jgi:signal transduction histidine kinase
MIQNKTEYIQSQINRDFCLKSRNAGIAQMVAAVIFTFVHINASSQDKLINIAIINIVVVTLLRMHYLKNYLKSDSFEQRFLKKIDFILIFTALNWAILATTMIQTNSEINHELIITLVLIVNLNIGSILSLSHRYKTLLIYNLFMLFPIAFFAIKEAYITGDKNILWLISYCAINLIYISRQSKLITLEMTNKFSNEYDLIKSLKEIESSKKNLEEETMKTFHASRLSSLGEMAGGIAHEINNPLTIIQATSKSILGHEAEHLDEGIKNKISKIHFASERIAKIVRGMKNVVSKNDTQEHEFVKMSLIIDISMSLFEERLKNDLINVSIQNPNDPIAFCNQLQISQILINLISNSLDELSEQKNDKFLTILVEDNDTNIYLRVINSGRLINEEIANKIFEPFFTTKQIGKGTGLGLSISKTLAQNNRGDLHYENFQNNICFKLTLNKN